ncbi:MAG: PQQ-dependent sugar dehydrogenase [Verrucomicrobiae bacterium]|nr:PQQ-dependent sugar dehydrogenase [Verrucomicrobiae bacterium]
MRCCFFLVSLIVSAISTGGFAAETDAAYDPGRLTPTTLATGLDQPMELQVAPDGRIFFIEIKGKLRIFHPENQQITEAGQLTVTNQQENGLIGMTLDPDFANNQWIYLQYSPPDYSGQHVSRFKMNGDQIDLGSEKLLLKFEEQRLQCCHHAGSLEFGPDGCLYIATGDNTHPAGDSKGFAPIDERPDRMPWDAQKSAANKFSYNGKVLRIRPTAEGGYEVPDGNLFSRDGSEGLPEIYVMGCRNPWRMNVDQKTGYVYWGEVGPDAGSPGDRGPAGHDEVNQARRPGYFGWPYFVGPNLAYPDVNFETGEIGPTQDPAAPVNDSPNSVSVQTLPPAQPAFIYYHRGVTDDFPMLREGGRTACAGPVYYYDPDLKSATKLPPHFDRTLFIYEWTRGWIFAVKLDDHSDIESMEEVLPDAGFQRPIDLTFGPEGALYLLDYGETWGSNPDSKLVRVDYIRGNRPPRVKLTTTGATGRPPLKVTLSSEGTADPDEGDTLSYDWKVVPSLNGNAGTLSNEPNPTLEFDVPGAFQVVLTVTDQHGSSATASAPVLVGNEPPQVEFLRPRDGDFYDFDGPIAWEVKVTDAEDAQPEPDRVKLFHKLVPGAFADTDASLTGAETLPPGLELMKKSDCFNCHMVDRKLVGPAYLEVAAKYRGQPLAIDEVAKRIVTGSTGIWGEVPMIPHPQHGVEQSRQMVEWILSLGEEHDANVLSGLTGEFTLPKPDKIDEKKGPGVLIVEASYLDGGAPPIAPLSGSQTIRLRYTRLQAEDADEIGGLQVMGDKVGAINHDAFLKFAQIDLSGRTKAKLSVASNGSGGVIEIRQGSREGELLGSLEVPEKMTGDWGKYVTKEISLNAPDKRGDLYVRFVNPGKGGLMNLDWVEFVR